MLGTSLAKPCVRQRLAVEGPAATHWRASVDTIKRSGLVAELKLAHEEAARLDEMIQLLASALDDGRMRQLRIEKLIQNRKALRLHHELRALDTAKIA